VAILTGQEIKRQVELGTIVIEPFFEDQLNPNSYNLRLGPGIGQYFIPQPQAGETLFIDTQHHFQTALDMKREAAFCVVEIPDEGLVLEPGKLYLGSTVEYTETHGFAPMLEGRSSVARLGISVHLTAGFGDNSFSGHWTLELIVVHPVRIYAGVEICQIIYNTLIGEQTKYTGKYQNQSSAPKPSGLWKDFQKEKLYDKAKKALQPDSNREDA
jgi:dCTP deaminase